MKNNNTQAVLFSAVKPSDEQMAQFGEFVKKKYGDEFSVVWQKSDRYSGGFGLEVDTDIYDWSTKGRFEQLKAELLSIPSNGNVVSLLKEKINSWTPKAVPEEIGTVVTVGDGIAKIDGLDHVAYGEIVVFENGVKGMVMDLQRDEAGCILFDALDSISEGSTVRRTGKTAGVPVGDDFLGRVINPLGEPVDGKGPVNSDGYRPIENSAPGIIDRQPVSKPLETGILAIDSMFPIGRGQRELIIGDRQTGKTAIALDTILNQKGRGVICIYVAIGQKASSVAQFAETLRRYGAMEYTIIINSGAGDPAPIQYIAPYAGCAMGEYFMNCGKDVLIVYDDLSKHAIAYRALSLLLERSPGREAYPGDVFYLHSRLLERAAHLSDAKGGGSMTALPIVETQAEDVSAYIPTNIISITDGQVFLESDLFFAGQRPAINVGLSVSRVGSAAQTKAMKKAAGTLRLNLAQYREMEVFTQFSSDLDDSTKQQLAFGQNLMYMLRQPQYRPLKQYEQVIVLTAASHNKFKGIELSDIGSFRNGLLLYMEEQAKDLCESIERTGLLSEEDSDRILSVTDSYITAYKKKLGR